ncbi:MAG TPA: hypothetical protein VFH43_10050 [Candidatus Kapabacteria bacterium]|nr:hypothetical protein [Candidatus Kapabacteria bacterium]
MRSKLPYIVIVLTTAAIAIALWPSRSDYPIDDTFITFRYAEHLAMGHGLVWNIGGPPTEGYTNFLFVLLLAPFAWLGMDLLLASQIINVLAVAVSAIYIYRITISSGAGGARWMGVVPSILFLATPATWANALSGMETVVFGALSIAAVYHSLDDRRFYLGYLLFLLAALTRPEGAVVAMIVLLFHLLKFDRKSVLLSFIVGFALPLALYYIGKRFYFGHWLPNSFAVKVVQAVGEDRSMFQGLQAVKLFLLRVWPLLILAAVPLLFERTWRSLCLLVCALILIAAYTVPAPLMGFFDRFFHSSEVLIFSLAGAGLLALHRHLGLQQAGLAGGLLLALFIFSNTQSPRAKEILAWDLSDINRSIELIGEDIRTLPSADRLTFASSDAGIMPYVSRMKHFDLAGLNETSVAHAKSADEVVDQIMQARPDILVLSADWSSSPTTDTCRLISRKVHGKLSTAVDRLLTDPRFQHYQPVASYPTGLYDYAVLLDRRSQMFSSLDSAYRSRIGSSRVSTVRITCIN